MMQEYKRDILRRHREDICRSIHDINSIVSKLTDYEVITQYMEEDILSKPTRIQKCRELLNILPRRVDSAFDMFGKVLIDCNEPVAASYLGGTFGITTEHQLPSVFPDPNDPKIVKVRKCTAMNGDQMYEKFKRCTTDSEIYQMNSNNRGHCVVINNEIFEQQSRRYGTEKDVESLKELFKQLNFQITVHDNKTAQEIHNLIKHYKDMDHTNYNCFVMMVLSHGSHGNVYGVDGKEVGIEQIVISFDSRNCKSLCDKPKLFFIQACQGVVEDGGTQNSQKITEKDKELIHVITQKLDDLHLKVSTEATDAKHVNTATRADLFVAISTCPGFVSWRDKNFGTWFIQAVVYAFKYWAHSCELAVLMTRVNNLVQRAETIERKKQCPVWRSSLGKSLFFFPGLPLEIQPNVSQSGNRPNQIQPANPSANSTTVFGV